MSLAESKEALVTYLGLKLTQTQGLLCRIEPATLSLKLRKFHVMFNK